MQLDIRIPIGLLFSVLGLVIGIYGLVTIGDEAMYHRSLGTNLNIWTGVCLIAFGLVMLLPALRAQKRKALEQGTPSPDPKEATRK